MFMEKIDFTHRTLLIDTLGGLVTDEVTVALDATNKVFAKGALLGKFTSGPNAGKLGAFDPAAEDGRQAPYGILGNDVDVELAASEGSFVYLKGKFNQNEVSVIDGVTLLNHKDACRGLGIYLVNLTTEV
jgi:hypothetical protein